MSSTPITTLEELEEELRGLEKNAINFKFICPRVTRLIIDLPEIDPEVFVDYCAKHVLRPVLPTYDSPRYFKTVQRDFLEIRMSSCAVEVSHSLNKAS